MKILFFSPYLSILELKDFSKNNSGFGIARSLYVVEDVKKGDTVSAENVRSIRPRFGLHLKYIEKVLGSTFVQNPEKGTPLSFNLIKTDSDE
jgi:pseudaminic acid synthase